MASQAHVQPAGAATKPARRWTAYLPILQWLPHYHRATLRPDLVAGVTVAAFAILESMAYAGLAGLPIAAIITEWQQEPEAAVNATSSAQKRGGAGTA